MTFGFSVKNTSITWFRFLQGLNFFEKNAILWKFSKKICKTIWKCKLLTSNITIFTPIWFFESFWGAETKSNIHFDWFDQSFSARSIKFSKMPIFCQFSAPPAAKSWPARLKWITFLDSASKNALKPCIASCRGLKIFE